MFEQTKSAVRRAKQSRYQEILTGKGIDIGCGNDPITKNIEYFRYITKVDLWDISDGDAQYMASVPDNAYDFIHSSHCLEHMQDPKVALENWLRICKPGGYIILTVPDETLYERDTWPSQFNSDHKWSFRVSPKSNLPKSILVPEFIAMFDTQLACYEFSVIDAGFNKNLPKNVDQTMLPGVECAIEIILQKHF